MKFLHRLRSAAVFHRTNSTRRVLAAPGWLASPCPLAPVNATKHGGLVGDFDGLIHRSNQ